MTFEEMYAIALKKDAMRIAQAQKSKQPQRFGKISQIEVQKSDKHYSDYDIDDIVQRFATICLATSEDMMSFSRSEPVSTYRNVLIYVLHNKLNMTLNQVANFIGRDYSTILKASRRGRDISKEHKLDEIISNILKASEK